MASLTDTIEALLWEDESATLDFKLAGTARRGWKIAALIYVRPGRVT